MEEKLLQIKEQALRAIAQADDLAVLEDIRIRFFGRKGELSQAMGLLKDIPAQEKPRMGKLSNDIKNELTRIFDEKLAALNNKNKSAENAFDVSIPATSFIRGRIHPITATIRKIQDILTSMGFEAVDGPEVETEYNNFEALNIPADHPSRDSFDTFYVSFKDGLLLRSQTSTAQIRIMGDRKPPLQVMHAGKVYRPDTLDASHSFMFHQVEGFAVGEDITFANLRAVLGVFAKRMFGKRTKIRLRPHYFPFTEPSAEVDVSCMICSGKGCRVCKKTGWIEILGCGMVHPNVFKAVGYDIKKYSGFAFGMGVERIAMLVHGIDDIRMFVENDIRFLNQF